MRGQMKDQITPIKTQHDHRIESRKRQPQSTVLVQLVEAIPQWDEEHADWCILVEYLSILRDCKGYTFFLIQHHTHIRTRTI